MLKPDLPFVLALILLLQYSVQVSSFFVTNGVSSWQIRSPTVSSKTVCYTVVPGLDLMMIDAAIAVVSAAAGAASQLPRIQELEVNLQEARASLTEMEQEMVDKVTQLEDRLYQMDQEFEVQSGRLKKKWDETLRQELERVRQKVKEEYQFTLDIKVQEERSKMLGEKLNLLGSINGEKDVELVNLRLQQSQVKKANEKLEQALEDSKRELDRVLALKDQKNWWPF